MAKIQSPQVQPQPNQQVARLSHKAAAVAQQMENLEDDLTEATARAQQMENRANVAELQVKNLLADREEIKRQHETEIVFLRNDRDFYSRQLHNIEGQAEAMRTIADNMLSRRDDRPETQATPARDDALAAIERELANVPPKPAPSFLSATRETNGAAQ